MRPRLLGAVVELRFLEIGVDPRFLKVVALRVLDAVGLRISASSSTEDTLEA